ncbi:MAG: TetR/AcrR family transcriptional regulator [Acidimicrobiia bacterium]
MKIRLTCRLPACIPRKGAAVKRDTGHSRTQAERRAETRAALIAAGRALFAERGFAAAGREDIVERAGLTRGALYHHFSSKEDLFEAVYEEVEGELCEAIAVAAMAAADPVEQLRLGALSFLDAAATPEVRRIVLLDAPAVLPVEVRRALAERYGLGMVREALRGAERGGRLPLGPVDELALVVMAALHEAATSIADGADATSMRAVVEGLLATITAPAA